MIAAFESQREARPWDRSRMGFRMSFDKRRRCDSNAAIIEIE